MIQAHVVVRTPVEGVALIYKRFGENRFVFTGMLMFPDRPESYVWVIVTAEEGAEAGQREAVVVDELLGTGKLTAHQYQCDWKSDPYDPEYAGVAGTALRCPADDEVYDARFPDHP